MKRTDPALPVLVDEAPGFGASPPRAPRRWPRVLGGMALAVALITVGAFARSNGKKTPTYSTAQRASFVQLARGDPSVAPLLQAAPSGLLKVAENSCTYLAEGHTHAELIANLSTTPGVPPSLAESVAHDAEASLCPSRLVR